MPEKSSNFFAFFKSSATESSSLCPSSAKVLKFVVVGGAEKPLASEKSLLLPSLIDDASRERKSPSATPIGGVRRLLEMVSSVVFSVVFVKGVTLKGVSRAEATAAQLLFVSVVVAETECNCL